MGVFEILVGFHEDYMQEIRKFWWREKREEKSIVELAVGKKTNDRKPNLKSLRPNPKRPRPK
jgi:hypothetical protein